MEKGIEYNMNDYYNYDSELFIAFDEAINNDNDIIIENLIFDYEGDK